jgi:hypothetical protein
MVEKERYFQMSPKEKVTEFTRLRKENTVLPMDDTNLSSDIYHNRVSRVHYENLTGKNEALSQMALLLKETHTSEYFQKHLLSQFGLEMAQGWTRWDEEMQEKIDKRMFNISLRDGMFGIFDSNPRIALQAEANYYHDSLSYLQATYGHDEEIRKWGEDIVRRVKEI